jgi:nucleotide-binding universal stress UspA family protein
MHLMLAYDHSRNARIALDAVGRLFAEARPDVTLITVIEAAGSATDAEDDFFREHYQDLRSGAEAAAAELTARGFPTRVLVAEGDARKMILRATQERKPDLLVMARHSHKPDKGFFASKIDAFVEEFDHMTFGSVSAFLARRVQVPLLIIPAPTARKRRRFACKGQCDASLRRLPVQEPANQGPPPHLDSLLHLLLRLVQHGAAGLQHAALGGLAHPRMTSASSRSQTSRSRSPPASSSAWRSTASARAGCSRSSWS